VVREIIRFYASECEKIKNIKKYHKKNEKNEKKMKNKIYKN